MNILTKHIELPVRDIENIFPLELLLKCSDPQCHNLLNVYLNNVDMWDIIKNYVDMKNRFLASNLHEKKRNINEKKFWLDFLAQSEKLNFTIECLSGSQNCCLSNKDNCPCVIFPGLGSYTSKKVLELIDKSSISESVSYFTSSKEWFHLGETVFYWSLSQRPVGA